MAPNGYLLSEKSASKGGGRGLKSQQKTDFFILTASLQAYPIISLSIIYINSQNKSHIKNQYIFGMHGTIIPFHSNTFRVKIWGYVNPTLIKMVKKLILSRVFLYNQHLNLELSHCIESSASITAVILNDYSIRERDDSIV